MPALVYAASFLFWLIVGNAVFKKKKFAFGRPIGAWPERVQDLISYLIRGAMMLTLVFVLGFVGPGIFWCVMRSCAWIAPSNLNYPALVYKAAYDTSDVELLPLPHDCDWLASPMGDKLCHYEKLIESGERPNSVVVKWNKVREP